ncbi:outer membrane protein [Devosia sp.]|uniref:outer membrane protein n=1 Tax=Devosia sp. TaxID=1871048 RepID=UPI003BAA33F8
MNKIALLAGAALVTLSGSAFAADLIVDEPAAMTTPAADTTLYFELLGGASLEGKLNYEGDGSDDLQAGGAVAGVIGFGTGIEGLSVEADAFYTQRDYSDSSDDYTLKTGSLMADLKYTVNLNDSFAVYGAVGLGGVYLHDESSSGTVYVDSWGAGYLLKAGVTAKVADQISLVGEVRYTNSFDYIDEEQSGTTSVLAGVHFGF